ncbi:MAG: GntR family transcriptional regulator [Alphaproteobacteria bacterium]
MSAARAGSPADRGATQSLTALLAIRDLVLDGTLAPGERLSEPALVKRIGVSRTPVRAALARLEAEGLVQAIPSGGYAVRRFSDEDVSDAIELRGVVEGLAARRAAERGVPPHRLRQMQQIVAALDAVVARRGDGFDFTAYVRLNEAYHDRLAALSGSAVIMAEIERVTALPFASPSAFVEAQAQSAESRDILVIAQAQHRAIVEAIELREGARAEALTLEHARIARTNLALVARDETLRRKVPGLVLVDATG